MGLCEDTDCIHLYEVMFDSMQGINNLFELKCQLSLPNLIKGRMTWKAPGRTQNTQTITFLILYKVAITGNWPDCHLVNPVVLPHSSALLQSLHHLPSETWQITQLQQVNNKVTKTKRHKDTHTHSSKDTHKQLSWFSSFFEEHTGAFVCVLSLGFVFTSSAIVGLSRSFLVVGGVCELSDLFSSSSSSSLLRFEPACIPWTNRKTHVSCVSS